MNWLLRTFTSSIGKKVLVGLSGLGLIGFLLGHIFGNLHIYMPDENGISSLDVYAGGLHQARWLPVAEIGILVLFLVHIAMAIRVTKENRKARGGQGYAMKTSRRGGFGAFTSRFMPISGMVVMLFLVVHVGDFRLEVEEMLEERNGFYNEVVEALSNPGIALLYALGSLFIGWHLMHGVQSALRSVGLQHPKYTPLLEKGGMAFALVLGLLFASIPVAVTLGVLEERPGADGDEHDDEHDEADERSSASNLSTPSNRE